jgi:hypothetical protein
MEGAMGNNKTLAHLVVEYWKLLRAFERAIDRLPHEHVAKTAAQLRFSAGRLESLFKEGGLNLVTFDGQKFESPIFPRPRSTPRISPMANFWPLKEPWNPL